MVKTNPKSRIEVWKGEYINNSPSSFAGTTIRTDEDKNVDILQIEPGNSPDDYMVEIVEKKEDAGEMNKDAGEDYYPFIEGFRDAMEVVSDAFKTMNDDPNFEFHHPSFKTFANNIINCLYCNCS